MIINMIIYLPIRICEQLQIKPQEPIFIIKNQAPYKQKDIIISRKKLDPDEILAITKVKQREVNTQIIGNIPTKIIANTHYYSSILIPKKIKLKKTNIVFCPKKEQTEVIYLEIPNEE